MPPSRRCASCTPARCDFRSHHPHEGSSDAKHHITRASGSISWAYVERPLTFITSSSPSSRRGGTRSILAHLEFLQSTSALEYTKAYRQRASTTAVRSAHTSLLSAAPWSIADTQLDVRLDRSRDVPRFSADRLFSLPASRLPQDMQLLPQHIDRPSCHLPTSWGFACAPSSSCARPLCLSSSDRAHSPSSRRRGDRHTLCQRLQQQHKPSLPLLMKCLQEPQTSLLSGTVHNTHQELYKKQEYTRRQPGRVGERTMSSGLSQP